MICNIAKIRTADFLKMAKHPSLIEYIKPF
jgi:preprotein translocase subunit Sss1